MIKVKTNLEHIIELAQKGDPDAKIYIINKYMPLLISHARRFTDRGYYADAISLYTLRILEGLPRFNKNFREDQHDGA